MILGNIPSKSLAELGWPELCAGLSQRARTPMGRALCLALLPGDDAAEARARLARVEEARLLFRLEKEVPLDGALDVRLALGRAARDGALEPAELIAVSRFIRASSSARRFLFSQADRAPLLFAWGETITELSPLADRLDRVFDAGGKLLDTASPLLAELRERARGLHRAIKARLETMLLEPELTAMLRDTYYSVRGDRYVLPVRAEHKSHLPGIVHNASGSGQTLFVEPQELVELGNQLTIAESSALEEEQRILAELSALVGAQAPALGRDVETLGRLDEVTACGRLSDGLAASPPALLEAESGSTFSLLGLRHPLLVLQQQEKLRANPARAHAIVANDVLLPAPARALIVSGPNAGGKTVTITAVGLCALLARAGLPVPAGPGSSLPLYRTVYTAIGDEGDLSRDLSTFTAHLTALKHILEAAGPGCLVLIDEMAADTDPREGAAIAVAALEHLVDRGAQVLITTHLEELKALGLSDPRFASASVGFDLGKLAPTYQLALGAAGASSAIEIARRVGLPASLCERARSVLGGGTSAVSQAVEKLERERNELSRARAELAATRSALEAERGNFERERRALKALEKATREGARDLLIEDLEAKRLAAAKLVAELQATPSIAGAVEAQRGLAAMADRERREADRARSRAGVQAEVDALETGETADDTPAPAARRDEPQLVPGAQVRHARFGSEGVLVELLSGGQAMVQLGALKTKVPLEDLVPLHRRARAPEVQFKKTKAEKLERAEAARAAPLVSKLPTVDVRGQRVDEAIRSLDEGLDQFLRDGAALVHVLHGHGTGALKGAVREHLARSPYVKRARPAEQHEGGDQVTVVELRG